MTSISLFTSIDFAKPISYGQKAISLLSNYFYLGGMRATVMKGGELWFKNEKLEWHIIALKVASFALLFPVTLPLLAIHTGFRYMHSFTVNVTSQYVTNHSLSRKACRRLGFEDRKPILIYVFKQDLQNRPFHHLQKFCQAVKEKAQKVQDPRLIVSYLKGELTSQFREDMLEEASDTGGVSRDYLYELTKAVIEQTQFFVESPPFCLPQIDRLSPQMEQFFQNIGILMMYCYHSKRQVETPTETLFIHRLTGQYFDEAMFNAMLCLKAEEIDTSELSLQAKIKMCVALVQSKVDAGAELNWLIKSLRDLTTSSQLNSAAEINQFMESLGIDAADLPPLFQTFGDQIKVETVKSNREKFIEETIYLCMQRSTNMEVKKMFKPMHAIAKGMKEICYPGQNYSLNQINAYWDQFIRSVHYQTFSDKVQGSRLTPALRESIINNIIYEGSNDKITADVRRLKEWLAHPKTSEEEVRMFVKFTTGATTLLEGQTIKVLANELYPSIVPQASTCALTLTFSTRYPEDLIEQQLLQSEEEKSKTFISYLKQEMQRMLNQFDMS